MPENAATTCRRALAFVFPVLLLAFLVLPISPAAASQPLAYSGKAKGCEYEVTFDVDSRTFAGKVTKECKLEGAIFRGDYENEDATLATTEGKVSPFHYEVDMGANPEWVFAVPVEGTTLETLLEQIGTGNEAKTAGQATVDELMESVVGDLYAVLTEKIELKAGGEVEGVVEKQEKLESKGREICSDNDELDSFCEDGKLKTAKAGTGTGTESESESEAESEEAAMCPANLFEKQVIFICLPTFLEGDFNSGSKPIVILPGGLLIALPIGGTNLFDLSTTPTVSSKQAIVSAGGLIIGFNLRLKTADLALAAGAVDMAGSLTLEGENINVGSVNLQDALGALPVEMLNNKEFKAYSEDAKAINMPDPISETGSLSTPIWLGASHIEVKPSEAFQLGSDSTLSTSDRGGAGGTPADAAGGLPEGEAPGGEGGALAGAKGGYGGSHGGYGGIVEQLGASERIGIWWEAEGRGQTFDSPFAPTEPGAGGSGNYRDSVIYGADGGGVVRINSPKASVEIDGRVDASGGPVGTSQDSGPYSGGEGGGAGGSIYVTAKSLAGGGEFDADGGGYPADYDNSDGGDGGGGRIALVYGESSGWSGSAHADGGVDRHFEGIEGPEEFYAGTGGAGTVFTQQATFNELGTVKEGEGEFAEGTLTIDGGLPAGYYPPPDGTPIANSWGGPNRKLVLSGEARGYGKHPDFGTIEVLGGSDLSGEFGIQKLEVSAGTLKVDPSSRIDMTGRGYRGGTSGGFYDEPGNVDAGETAPGFLPATRDFGGSHGGAGGVRAEGAGYQHPEEGDVPGETYDDPLEPSLPGGGGAGEWDVGIGTPGGGVLDVTAGTLDLEGELSADGEDGAGPTAIDPTWFNEEDGAGAGGSVLVHAERLSGDGTVRADGGWSCVGESPPLLPGVSACETPEGGAGGGGRVAVYATSCNWTGALSAQGGINQEARVEAEAHPGDEGLAEDAAEATGEDGSAYFSALGGSCASSGGTSGGGGGNGGGGSGPPPGPAPDRVRPALSHLKVANGALSLVVDEPGTLVVKLARCKIKRVHHRRTTVCKQVKTMSVAVEQAGAVHVQLPAGLHPGRYLVTVQARDAAGNTSQPVSRRFVAKGKRHRHPHPRHS